VSAQAAQSERDVATFECPTCALVVKTDAMWPPGWVLGDGGFFCSKKCGEHHARP
jgi:hypothetical protein